MMKRQFDEFYELECPNCGKIIDLEIILNSFRRKGGA